MIAKEALIDAARRARAGSAARPANAAALGAIGEALEAGEPKWWAAAQQAWAGRHFGSGDEALLLIWAAVHLEALNGDALAAQLPTCGGKPTAALGSLVRRFLDSPPAGFYASLARSHRFFSSYWSSRWREPAEAFFQKRGLSYILVELDSVGGLGACLDVLFTRKGFDSGLIEARVVLEEQPLDLSRDEDAKWVVACCAPDDIRAVKDFAHSALRLRELLASQPEFLQKAACPLALAPAFVAKNIPVDPEAGLLVASVNFALHVPPEQHAAAAAAMAQALAPWGDRALWSDVAQSADPATTEVRVCRARGTALSWHRFSAETRLAAGGTKLLSDPAASAAFLA